MVRVSHQLPRNSKVILAFWSDPPLSHLLLSVWCVNVICFGQRNFPPLLPYFFGEHEWIVFLDMMSRNFLLSFQQQKTHLHIMLKVGCQFNTEYGSDLYDQRRPTYVGNI